MRTHQTILGISPGTRSIGLAVIRKGELVEWRVRTFKGSWSQEKLKDILYAIMNYVAEHDIKMIGLKRPDILRSSAALDQLVSEISVWAKMNKIKVVKYPLPELKKGFSTEKKFTKTEMIKQLIRKNPELYIEYNKEQRNRNPYYVKMFEAIATAKVTLLRLK